MFISLDVFVKVANIEQERRALAVVQVGQVSVLNQAPEFPIAHAKVFRSLFGAEEAVLGWGRKTHLHLGYDFTLDNIASVHIKSIHNVTK